MKEVKVSRIEKMQMMKLFKEKFWKKLDDVYVLSRETGKYVKYKVDDRMKRKLWGLCKSEIDMAYARGKHNGMELGIAKGAILAKQIK
jgi:hypothetical protein